MHTAVKKLPIKREISSTLYDPQKTVVLLGKMQIELRNINTCIAFSNCIPTVANTTKKTMHGQFIVGSPLPFYLHDLEHTTK